MSEWKNGLPPVGEECEWCGERGGYFVPADVVAVSDDEIVLRHKDYQDYKPGQFDVFKHKYMKFRPLKSEAERKRDEAVGKIAVIIADTFGGDSQDARELYDAGLRKVNPLTDEQIDRVKYSTRYDFGECSYETAAYREGMRDARRIIMGEES